MIDSETPKQKIINNISEIYDGENLLLKDFVNLDLSNLDLRGIPEEKRYHCFFYNTSFKNTGIKFIPNKLRKITKEEAEKFSATPFSVNLINMSYCDFSNNNLTYLNKDLFDGVNIFGCNFSNTGINFFKTLVNVILDSSYEAYDFDDDYWKFEYGTVNWPDFIDIYTIIKNPFLKVPSFRILNAIQAFVFEENQKYNNTIGFKYNSNDNDTQLRYITNIVKQCESFLEYDKQGYGKKFYEKLSPFMSIQDKFEFFMFNIKHLNIKNVDFEDIPVEVLRYFTIQNNTFENVILNNSIKDLLRMWNTGEHILDTIPGYENKYISFYLPNINYSSWQENENARKRVSDSAITFFTKVYLELSRTCNANCSFCRNKSFDNCNYDLENIKETLNDIKSCLNAVVIGGGEPTLKLDDIKYLHQAIINDNLDWHMFSNGTNPTFINDDYIMDNFKLNISRHATNDLDNANIFGVNPNRIMTTKELEKLNDRNGNVTLNAVCFKGGLDSFDKIINYINYAQNTGCQKVLIQDLQRENSLGSNNIQNKELCIETKLFAKVREHLKNMGFKEKYPIYATGGYVSYILKNKEGFSVTLQKYITQKELDEEWPKSIKRAFDLSIAPNGNLYENWNQSTGLVRKL